MAIIAAHSHMNSGNRGEIAGEESQPFAVRAGGCLKLNLPEHWRSRFNNRKTNQTSSHVSSPRLDPRSHWLSDGGVGGRLQSQGAEGGSAGGDGAVGGHPHNPPRAGTQPEDLGLPQRAARVGSRFDSFFSDSVFFVFLFFVFFLTIFMQLVGRNRGVILLFFCITMRTMSS